MGGLPLPPIGIGIIMRRRKGGGGVSTHSFKLIPRESSFSLMFYVLHRTIRSLIVSSSLPADSESESYDEYNVQTGEEDERYDNEVLRDMEDGYWLNDDESMIDEKETPSLTNRIFGMFRRG